MKFTFFTAHPIANDSDKSSEIIGNSNISFAYAANESYRHHQRNIFGYRMTYDARCAVAVMMSIHIQIHTFIFVFERIRKTKMNDSIQSATSRFEWNYCFVFELME